MDGDKLFQLASLGLTTAEIASVLECSPDTLERNFKEEMDEGKEKCKASVRRKQFELAMAGNPTMLIWLGKQILGQRDKVQQVVSGPGGGPVQHEVRGMKEIRAELYGTDISKT